MVRLPGSGAASSAGDGPGSGSASGDNGVLDLSKATMSALGGLADVAARAAEDLSRHLDGPGFDPVGIPELRAAIAERYRVRGLPTDPEQIMVTIGAQHAIALLARVLVSRGDRVLIEQPSYPHAVEAFRAAGARLVPVSVTARGSAGSAAESGAQAGRVGGRLRSRRLLRLGRTRPAPGTPGQQSRARLPDARLPQPDRADDARRAADPRDRGRLPAGHGPHRGRDHGRARHRPSGRFHAVRGIRAGRAGECGNQRLWDGLRRRHGRRRPRHGRHGRVGGQDHLGRPAHRLDPGRARPDPPPGRRTHGHGHGHADPRATHRHPDAPGDAGDSRASQPRAPRRT
ncbi:pyridoxal phosphate-dependent aminotransferase [Cryobacterium breve]|uniref:Pyridoxal phosphate-dependent aminotransferase n=1 Tax=Cryobacterium breve TaxID=1259258 RepID=A0ABY7N9Q2_9MICO|nr:pyridoxal phosphate-dependent aminotransferase [Cryobacterium breve]